ncbi:hypothetical protein [Candidatus Lokiarchaeum ossiferum]|uniref:hypothetical protein n=1 Tax=Candidatus Lokiarchaeum ossiferum TaxID=2951803 RepID=UPI00352F9438
MVAVLSYDFLSNFGIFLLFGFFLINYKKKHQNRPVKDFFLAYLLGMLNLIFVCLYFLKIIPSKQGQLALRGFYIFLYCLQIFFFYRFLDGLRRIKRSQRDISLIVFFITVTVMGYFYLVLTYNEIIFKSPVNNMMYFICRLSLKGLQIFVFGFCGIPVCYNMWKYTSEKLSEFFYISMVITTLGYVIGLVIIIPYSFDELSLALSLARKTGEALTVIGFSLFLIVSTLNLKYIYRLPFDHYMLIVIHKETKLNLLSLTFETKNSKNEMDENYFTFLNSTLTTLHQSSLKSKGYITKIINNDVSLILDAGEYITATVATNQVSLVLQKGLKKFVEEFESMFEESLKNTPSSNERYKAGEEIFNEIFPFLKHTDGAY